jgi:hypothetical protein
MTLSAILMGAVGVVLSFAPHETLAYLEAPAFALGGLILQILGALYFAFAMVNWMAKGNLIGGIYGRPIAIGNLTHFVVGALALAKGYVVVNLPVVLVGAIVYGILAVLFTIVFFTHPVKG